MSSWCEVCATPIKGDPCKCPANVDRLKIKLEDMRFNQNWIKCSERLPKMGERVLWRDVGPNNGRNKDDALTFIGILRDGVRKKYVEIDFTDHGFGLGRMTHWMPLPGEPE